MTAGNPPNDVMPIFLSAPIIAVIFLVFLSGFVILDDKQEHRKN